MIVNPGPQPVQSVPVDPVATAVRGFSSQVRSDIPPVQPQESVRYTRGRPSEDEPPSYGPARRKPRSSEPPDTEAEEQPALDANAGGQQEQSPSQEERPQPEWVAADDAVVAQLQHRDDAVGFTAPAINSPRLASPPAYAAAAKARFVLPPDLPGSVSVVI